jgi:hypothetical protein
MTILIAGLFGLNFFSVNDMRYTAMVTTNQGRDSHTRGIHAQGLKKYSTRYFCVFPQNSRAGYTEHADSCIFLVAFGHWMRCTAPHLNIWAFAHKSILKIANPTLVMA